MFSFFLVCFRTDSVLARDQYSSLRMSTNPNKADADVRKERHSGDPKSSATGTGAGAPKKDGAGGKGTWGKPGDEDGPAVLDKNDPNYDSDDEKKKAWLAAESDEEKKKAWDAGK